MSIAGLPEDGTNGGTGTVPFAEMTWARPTLANQTVGGGPGRPANVVSVGDVIVVEKVDKPDGANAKPYPPKTYALRQVPNVEGGVVVMDTQTGRVLAMSGGWSYGRSQFNRAVQAARQPGSAFKPFVYLAAMDSGLTPASVGQDEPFSYDPGGGQPVWSPKNYGGDYMGAMSLQRALELSRNLVTVRVAQQIGMKKVVEVAKEFGVTDNMHAYLPMALGAGETTLLRMTMAYAMLANGALEITPSLVDRVQDRNGKTVYRHEPRACPGCGEQAAKPADAAGDRRSAQALPRSGLGRPDRAHAAGRDDARHGGPARGAGAADHGQDRHDQRRARQLVHGLDARHHHRHLRRLRRAAHPGARQHGDRQRQRRTDLRAHRPARSSRASRRPRSASRPACAWSSGPTRAARSTRSSSPAPSPAPATAARWLTVRRGPFRAETPAARARSRPAAPSVRAFPARARRTKTVTPSEADGASSSRPASGRGGHLHSSLRSSVGMTRWIREFYDRCAPKPKPW